GGEVNEYAIGLDVLEKPPSFDTRIDSSVRAEMSRLRRALNDYYARDGCHDPWRIVFPQRGYVPVFSPAVPVQTVFVESVSSPDDPLDKSRPDALKRRMWLALAGLPVAAAATAIGRVWPLRPPIRSVVVLPFSNLTGDASRDYIADGVTEGLTDS